MIEETKPKMRYYGKVKMNSFMAVSQLQPGRPSTLSSGLPLQASARREPTELRICARVSEVASEDLMDIRLRWRTECLEYTELKRLGERARRVEFDKTASGKNPDNPNISSFESYSRFCSCALRTKLSTALNVGVPGSTRFSRKTFVAL